MSLPKAVLFDAGGTLVTMHPGPFGDVVEPILGERPDPDRMLDAHYQAMAAIGADLPLLEQGPAVWWPWWLAQYLQLSGLPPHPAAVAELAATHGLWRLPLPGSLEGVRSVADAGCRVGVVSNADGHVRDDLEAAGFGGLFEVIIDSTAVGVSKPDPAIFDHALEALEVEASETWYVGDSLLFDLGGAEAAGLAEFVLVDPVGLHGGYSPRVGQLTELVDLMG
ncbi:MAG: HAD family hydrolase [Acidimicrobiia bacterium]